MASPLARVNGMKQPQDLRPRRNCQQRPGKPAPSSASTEGSGTLVEVPEISMLSKRQLPELLLYTSAGLINVVRAG